MPSHSGSVPVRVVVTAKQAAVSTQQSAGAPRSPIAGHGGSLPFTGSPVEALLVAAALLLAAGGALQTAVRRTKGSS